MTLASFTDLLARGRRSRRAVGAFTCYDLEVARAVVDAAGADDVGVIILISRETFVEPGGDHLVAALRAVAERAPAAACVQLDHVADLDLVTAAFDLGCGAVMFDGSKLPFDENLHLSARAVQIARRRGGAIEVELGHVSGNEDVATATAAMGLTDPALVPTFLRETTADCLAVSIGNIHGEYRDAPLLDWPRLDAIRAATTVPLSLHGASGLSTGDLRRAVGYGVAKINVNTDLRRAYLEATRSNLDELIDGFRLLALHRLQMDAVRLVARAKLDEFRTDPANLGADT